MDALLQGDPTYLIVNTDGVVEKYGLNAVCTHLGCVVPWVAVSGLGTACSTGPWHVVSMQYCLWHARTRDGTLFALHGPFWLAPLRQCLLQTVFHTCLWHLAAG